MSERKVKLENKLFLGFGVITILAGIFLFVDGQYISGASGTVVGVWLTYMNWKAIKK